MAWWQYNDLRPGIPVIAVFGIPVSGAVTVAPSGQVLDGSCAVEPDGRGNPPTVVIHGGLVDDVFAEFLRAHGFGDRLIPVETLDQRGQLSRKHTPPIVKQWLAGEVSAGRILVADALPPTNVRRELREAAGLSRSQVAELISVTAEAIRTWEEGLREPQAANRPRYLELLTQWHSKQQEPAAEPVQPEPDTGRSDPQRYPGEPPRRRQPDTGDPLAGSRFRTATRYRFVPPRERARPPWRDVVERKRGVVSGSRSPAAAPRPNASTW